MPSAVLISSVSAMEIQHEGLQRLIGKLANRGIDLDLGGNPGAIGIDHLGAQGSAVESVRIDATGAYAGRRNNGALGPADYDVEITGGRYAFLIDSSRGVMA